MDPNIQRFLLILILVGLLLIFILISRVVNQRKSRRYRESARRGPSIERYTDPGKALKADEIYSTDEAKTKAFLWWNRSGITEGICGVCTNPIKNPDGFLVSKKMVLKSEGYINRAIKPLMEFGLVDSKAKEKIREEISGDDTPWLVCDHCMPLFSKY